MLETKPAAGAATPVTFFTTKAYAAQQAGALLGPWQLERRNPGAQHTHLPI